MKRIRPFVPPPALTALWLGPALLMAADPKSVPPLPDGVPDAWLPGSTALVFHSTNPAPLLDLLLDPAWAGQLNLEKGGAGNLKGVARYVKNELGCDWQTAVRRSMARGFSFASGPGGEVVLITRSDDPGFLVKLNDAAVKAGLMGNPEKVVQTIHGTIGCWTLSGGKEYHAVAGDCLIFSNRLAVLKQVLDLRAGAQSPSESLAGLDGFRSAKSKSGSGTIAQVFAAPALVNALPAFRRGANAPQQPMAVLLLGRNPQPAGAPAAEWMVLDLEAKGRSLAVRLAGERLAGPPASFAAPPAPDGVLPNVKVPRQIAAVSLWRDLRGFYAAKDTLFPERTSALIFFENLMGIYFSGRDLTEDVLGALDPHVRLVAAEQAYDPALGTPAVKVPAFALIFRMRQPERFSMVAEEAWQKALGLVNFTRGQKAQPGLILDKRDHGGVRYTFAAFSAAEEPDTSRLDVRFNFRPSIARAGEFLILSTTGQLTDDLIDALRQPAPPVAASSGLMEIDGGRLAAILAANRETIVRGNMLKKGQARAAAEKELSRLTAIARMVGQATLRTGEVSSEPFLNLELSFGAER